MPASVRSLIRFLAFVAVASAGPVALAHAAKDCPGAWARLVQWVRPGEAGSYRRAEDAAFRAHLERLKKTLEHALARNPAHREWLRRLQIEVQGGQMRMPALSRILALVEQAIDELPIPAADKLYPARVYRTREGKLIALRRGESVPRGAQLFKDELIPREDFLRMVASGRLPIGEPGMLVNPGGAEGYPGFWHDVVGHFGALVEDPRLMAETKRAATRMGSFRMEPYGENFDTLVRWGHANESLILTPTESRPVVARALGRVGLADRGEPWSYAEVRAALERSSPAQLAAVEEELRLARNQLFRESGGTARDLFEHEAQIGRRYQDPSDAPWKVTPQFLGEVLTLPNSALGWSESDRRLFLARYLTTLDHTSRISPAQWVEDVTQPGRLPPGRVRRFMCESGLFWFNNFNSLWAYCPELQARPTQ